MIQPELLLKLADDLVNDLLVMHEDTAIDLDLWPRAKRLVTALRCAARSDPEHTSGISYYCTLAPNHPSPIHETTIRLDGDESDAIVVHGKWTQVLSRDKMDDTQRHTALPKEPLELSGEDSEAHTSGEGRHG